VSVQKLIKDLRLSIDYSFGDCKGNRDYQASKIYQYHADLKEPPINYDKANKIVKRLDRLWNIKTVQLYPEKWEEDIGHAWVLSKRQAVIQLPISMRSVSQVIHEHSHGVVEAFRTYFPEYKNIKEPGHGPLFCGVYAFNYSWITDRLYVDTVEDLRYYSLRVLGKDPVLKFKKFFKEHE